MNAEMNSIVTPCIISLTEKNLWFITAGESSSANIVINGSTQVKLRTGQAGILALDETTLEVKQGPLFYIKADFVALVKLQAFIDYAKLRGEGLQGQHKDVIGENDHCFIPLYTNEPMSQKRFEYWLINQNVTKSLAVTPLIKMLRENEYYWIVNYLLEQSSSSESLEELGNKYGLSVSHFRRLTKVALGNATKVELCNWRLVRAILDLMGGRDSITDVALKHGYCSLSHFSNEVKNTFGLPPRELKNKIYEDVEK